MVATSLDQLNQQLLNRLKKAMNVANTKILSDMYQETGSFYTQGHPEVYIRTGALGDSPRTTSSTISKGGLGGSVSFEAYLNQSLGYQTPNPAFTSIGLASHFSDTEVLESAENHEANIKGKPGFWKRSESKFQKELNSAIRQFFK
jgi:hypothetical protein